MDTKTCTICKKMKLTSEFNVNRAKRDGLQNKCRDCGKGHAKGYYQRNKTKMREQIGSANKIRKAEALRKMREWKSERGCGLCPEREPVALDFHHTEDNKELSVAKAVSDMVSWSRIVAEMEKCVVLCSNCHRKLHAGLVSLGG